MFLRLITTTMGCSAEAAAVTNRGFYRDVNARYVCVVLSFGCRAIKNTWRVAVLKKEGDKWKTVGRKMTCKQVNAVRESLLFFAQREPAANRQFSRIDHCSFDCFPLSAGHCRLQDLQIDC